MLFFSDVDQTPHDFYLADKRFSNINNMFTKLVHWFSGFKKTFF